MSIPTKARLIYRLFHWWSFLLFIYISRQHIMKVGRRKITWEQEVGSPSVSTDGLGLSTSAETPQWGHWPGQTRTLCQKEKSFHVFFPVLPHEHLPSLVQYPAEVLHLKIIAKKKFQHLSEGLYCLSNIPLFAGRWWCTELHKKKDHKKIKINLIYTTNKKV